MGKLEDAIINRLRTYEENVCAGTNGLGYESMIADHIKQVFIDNGWIDTQKPITGPIHGVSIVEVDGRMTGSEWYAKFEKECREQKHTINIPAESPAALLEQIQNVYMDVARRASGIEEDSKISGIIVEANEPPALRAQRIRDKWGIDDIGPFKSEEDK